LGHALSYDSILQKVNDGRMKGRKKFWEATGNVIILVDEKRTQNGLFTAKEDRTEWRR